MKRACAVHYNTPDNLSVNFAGAGHGATPMLTRPGGLMHSFVWLIYLVRRRTINRLPTE